MTGMIGIDDFLLVICFLQVLEGYVTQLVGALYPFLTYILLNRQGG